MSIRKTIAINGAFLHREPYAEGRVASEYLRAFKNLKNEERYRDFLGDLDVFLTEDHFDEVDGVSARYQQEGTLPRPLWQQWTLPRMAGGKLLLNFCNIGPVFSSNAVAFIHDVNVYNSPVSFSKGYVIYTKLLNLMMGQNYKRIYTPSRYTADQLVKKGIVNKEKVRVLPHGVDHVDRMKADTSILAKYGLKKNGYVLGLSNSYKHKNMRVLMDVFDPSVRQEKSLKLPLVLFGPDMKDTFKDEGIDASSRVVFTGRISDAKRRALYENALCFAYPSKHDGFGLPPAEAMRLGCPTIVSDNSSMSEVCGEAAVYAEADESDSWMNAIKKFASDANLRSKYGAQGKAQTANMKWEESARILLDDLLEI